MVFVSYCFASFFAIWYDFFFLFTITVNSKITKLAGNCEWQESYSLHPCSVASKNAQSVYDVFVLMLVCPMLHSVLPELCIFVVGRASALPQ